MAWNEPGGNGNNQDPWGGDDKRQDKGKRGGNDQGPPDLDEALGQLQDKLGEIFGKKKGSGGGSNGRGPSAASSGGGATLLIVLLVVGALFWVGSGFYTVDQQERGVVLRLGKYSDTVGPGLQWNPPLIDTVLIENTTRVRSSSHQALMLTGDENLVDVSMDTQYVVSNAQDYVLNVRSPEQALVDAAESALRHVVGGSDMDSILTAGRDALAVDVEDRLKLYMANYKTGISITKVNIKSAQAPDQVQAAFDDVIKAREDEQRAKNEAETYAKGILPEARGVAERMKQEAEAYKQQVEANALGETRRFNALLAEYQKAPEVTRDRLYIETMQEVLANNPKVLVDVEGGNNMMYLPIDKLMENRPQRSVGGSGSGASVRLDDQSIREVTNQVVDQIRQRQSVRREARQ